MPEKDGQEHTGTENAYVRPVEEQVKEKKGHDLGQHGYIILGIGITAIVFLIIGMLSGFIIGEHSNNSNNNITYSYPAPNSGISPESSDGSSSSSSSTGYLGVLITDGSATVDGSSISGGKVYQVQSNSPAETAGLETDDLIVAVGNTKTTSGNAVAKAIQSHSSGDKVSLTVVRDGSEGTVSVTLGSPSDASTQSDSSAPYSADSGNSNS